MKLVSYSENGPLRPGVLLEGVVVDVGEIAQRATLPSYRSVRELIAMAQPDELQKLRSAANAAAAEIGIEVDRVTLAPPVPDPQKILCVGLNYADHVAETGSETSGDPIVFPKFPTSLVGHGAAIELPKVAPYAVDWEGELAVVIGRTARRVSSAEALNHVAGYTLINDISARDLQVLAPQWTMGKAFDTSGPCGPALVTADEIRDPQSLHLQTVLNGEVVQSATTGQMVRTVAELIAFLSATITLLPGDIIATGTPSGVGAARRPMRFLLPGDVVTVSIPAIGELTNSVRYEA